MNGLAWPELANPGSFETWLLAGSITVGTLVLLLWLRRMVRSRYLAMLGTERTELMELPFGVLSRTAPVFLIALSAYLGLEFLGLPERSGNLLNTAITIAVFWQAGAWLSAAVLAWLERKRRYSLKNDLARVGSISIIGLVVRSLIWILVVLLTLDNLGVDITALVAGLGIGGVAVALALQNILGDLFASLAIALDKPFVVGDFLSVGEVLGAVENIGIKSTRLRSLSGEQIIVSNADLLGSRVRNFGRMNERRIEFVLNLTYETPAEHLEAVPGLIREIVEAQGDTRFGRCHFASLGAHSLDFACAYFVLSADYDKHMDVLQAINLAILRKFQRLGIEFAYPTQKVLLAGSLSRAAPDPLRL